MPPAFRSASSFRTARRSAARGAPAFTLTFRTRGRTARRAFGHVGLLESYFDGDVDIDGDLALAFRAGFDGGFDRRTNPLVCDAQPLARVPLLEPLDRAGEGQRALPLRARPGVLPAVARPCRR